MRLLPPIVLLVICALASGADWDSTKAVRSTSGGTVGNLPVWDTPTRYIKDSAVSLTSITTLTAYVEGHTNLWDQCLTNGWLTGSNNWSLTKVGNRFWLVYSTNAMTLDGHPWSDVVTLVGSSTPNPRSGIWGMNTSKELVLLSIIHEASAGYWKMDTNASIIVSSNWWTDAWWTTNVSGEVVTRNLPL